MQPLFPSELPLALISSFTHYLVFVHRQSLTPLIILCRFCFFAFFKCHFWGSILSLLSPALPSFSLCLLKKLTVWSLCFAQEERRSILRALTRKMCLAEDVSLDDVADVCEDFTGADFKALLYNAQLQVRPVNQNHKRSNHSLMTEYF